MRGFRGSTVPGRATVAQVAAHTAESVAVRSFEKVSEVFTLELRIQRRGMLGLFEGYGFDESDVGWRSRNHPFCC